VARSGVIIRKGIRPGELFVVEEQDGREGKVYTVSIYGTSRGAIAIDLVDTHREKWWVVGFPFQRER
jgi:hypothetical protein